jgi:EAL domain-containing protein (putative c-di-GMP-specific phosphodiesterase class I)
MDMLRSDQVDEAQGYLFARPLKPDDLVTQLLGQTHFVAGSPS